jgi:hypothetical protein
MTNTVKKDTIPEVNKDTLKPVYKKGFQVYVGGGAEDNTNFGFDKSHRWIPQVAIGVQRGRVSFGGLFGYIKDIETSEENTITENSPATYTDPTTGQKIVFGGTDVTKNISTNTKYEILQPGAEVGVDLTKIIRLCLGAQYNIVKMNITRDTTGTVYQWVRDDAGNRRELTIPLEESIAKETIRDNYISLNPSIEFKTSFNSPINASIYGGAKFPIKSKYGTKPTLNVGAKIYFGNGRGYRRK